MEGNYNKQQKNRKKGHSKKTNCTFNKIVTMRCTKKGCQTYQLIRARNSFLFTQISLVNVIVVALTETI